MAAAAKSSPIGIEFVGVLPRWPDDDPAFVCIRLRATYGKRLVTIAEIVRDLGFSDRRDDQPSPEYNRIRRALHTALATGSVRRSGKLWGVP